ncbi:hypothetical protein WG901_16905 [Novosphingobium sp. PS1R-30]|uniref:Uncharacterized protein n=1 Tax=Novosphingobium anseongense TaxID=3133436 RepID=A0ABU8RZ42_9SPHN
MDHVLGRAALLPAANDNVRTPNDDRMLRAALHHFAAHGLGAAEAARENAETAFFAGDREQYRWWLGICRMLDRRMADAVRVRREAAQ